MALQLVLGTAGSGKTTYLYDQVIRMAGDNPATTYYFIVPEQFSIKTQYDMVVRHPDGGIINIDVTSIERLADMAFTVLHGEKNEFLPEIGKSMIIKKVLSDHKDDLKIFARNARRAGFVAEAKALVSELLQYGITREELFLLADGMEESPLKNKLSDAYTLYSGFMGYLTEGVHTAEGIYDAFASIAERSGILENSVVILDGFTGFTPSQYELLRCFLKKCNDVYVSFTADESVLGKDLKDYDMFRTSQLSVQKLCRLAEESKCEIKEHIFVHYAENGRSEAIGNIERNLFRRGRAHGTAGSDVMVYCGADPKAEAKYAAAEIERLIREEGYRYRDIGIVVSDMDVYGETLADELDKVNVKYFTDKKKSLGENECSGLIAIMLKLMEKGADTELLLSFAKNSLSGISHGDACKLENYCLAMGIKGSRFKKPFDKDYRGNREIFAADAEPVRQKLMKTVSPLLNVKACTANEMTDIIRNFFVKTDLENQLNKRGEELKQKGDKLRAKEYSKVFGAVEDILNQLSAYLGEEVMDVKEYREVLMAGLAEARVGLVPEGTEQIVIGDIERTRLKDIKALFLLGANDGKLPKPASSKGILSEYDKEELLEKGMELSPGMLRKTGRDRFYIYLALSKPSGKLYLSYCMAGEGGEAGKASQVVNRICGLFDDLKIKVFDDLPEEMRLLENDLGHQRRLSEKRDAVARSAEKAEASQESLSEKTAGELYGDKIFGSISRLETFARCPFRYFLTYGLKLHTRDEFKLENSDFGTVAHDALEHYGQALHDKNLNWFSVSEEESAALIFECARRATEDYNNGIFASSGKNKVVSERVEELLRVTVNELTKHLVGSDFEPYKFEHEFKVENELFTLNGKIDRIDICRKEGAESVKVIDYKSSTHSFDITKLYYGLSLQLPVYMQQALKIENIGDVRPAAMLYNHILNPVVDAPDASLDPAEQKDIIREAIFKEFKPAGIVNKDFEIIKSLDHAFIDAAGTLKDGVKSNKIPVGTKKDGDFDQYTKVISDKDFELLCTMAEEKMKNQARSIKQGNVAVTPASEQGSLVGCAYCDYKSVCGFDMKNGGRARSLKKYKEEEIWQKLRGVQEEQNG